MVKRKYIEQLNTSDSWQSPVAVIAHIDLDAFYAQCLGVRIDADPAAPLGCRQWNSLIAVNYPAREFGIKRGMSVDDARKLCPHILLPHVATFKKGELEWGFHDTPHVAHYKVSLDYFRRESRRIFEVFKENFRMVQKAGIDEGFVDLGPDVYKSLLVTHQDIFHEGNPEDEVHITHNELLDIGAELVKQVRLDIHAQLKYTCSAGIAPNKQLAKLGSGFKKPFNQTVVHSDEINEFLSNFPITKIGGWRGKIGKHVLDLMKIPEEVDDQCKYIREKFTIPQLERILNGDVNLATDLYHMVRGGGPSEVVGRTSVKSMLAVKNFRGNDLKTQEDIDQWLRVYSADIAGRLADLDLSDGTIVVPKTISLRKHSQSKQQPFELKGFTNPEIRDQIYHQAVKMTREFINLPCSYLATEISNFYELPRERLMFQNLKARKVEKPIEPEQHKPKPQQTQPVDETNLFLDDEEKCDACNRYMPSTEMPEHRDWHFAKNLQAKERNISVSPTKRTASPAKSSKKKKVQPPNQKNILDFFKK